MQWFFVDQIVEPGIIEITLLREELKQKRLPDTLHQKCSKEPASQRYQLTKTLL